MASKQPKLTNDHYTRFDLDRSTPSLWRVTFNNPPIVGRREETGARKSNKETCNEKG